MWKRFALFLCALSLAAGGCALSEGSVTELALKSLIPIDPDGVRIDLDGDGAPDEISLVETIADARETYELTVNDQTLSADGWGLNGEIYAMRLTEVDRAYLLVSEDGASDDPRNDVYRFKDGALEYCGAFGASAKSVAITDEGFTATVRGRVIQTWFRPADFIITDNGCFDEKAGEYRMAAPIVVEVPRDVYPMGAVVTLKRDVPLQISRWNAETALTLPAGAQAVIVATDDVEWLYIEAVEADGMADCNAGWLRLADAWSAALGEEAVSTMDLFDGLFYAD